MRVLTAAGVIALAACKSGGTDVRPAKPSIAVSIAGVPMTVEHAFIMRQPADGAYVVYLADEGTASCEELMGGMYLHRGERVLFSIGKRLATDGTVTSEVVDLSRRGTTGTIVPGAKAVVTGTAVPGEKVGLAVDADVDVEGEGRISIHGSVVADGCGAQTYDATDVPKAPHPSTATVTLAGRELPLIGARLRHPGDALQLSTAPLACSPSTPLGAVMVEHADGFWKVRGLWLGGDPSWDDPAKRVLDTDPDGKQLVATPGKTGSSADGATLALALSGVGKVGGYTVELHGAIEALDCP
jgi:hypothetical protein